MSRCTNEMTSRPSASCFLSKNWHWWDRADCTVWPLTFVGTGHAATNPWPYSVRPRYCRQLWLLPLNMSLSGVGAAAAPPAETLLRGLSWREHRLSANVWESDRFLSFSSFSRLCLGGRCLTFTAEGYERTMETGPAHELPLSPRGSRRVCLQDGHMTANQSTLFLQLLANYR